MEQVGVQLVADGGDKYLATLTATAAAEARVASAATGAVSGINALDDSQAAAARSAGILAGDATKVAGEVTDSAKAAAIAAGAYQDANGRWRDASGTFIRLGQDAEKGGKGVKGLGDDAEKGAKGVSLLDKIATGAAERIGHALTDAAQQAGQAIVQFIGDSISKAGDFEAGMNSFASVTGDALAESGQSLEDFKDLFISLGRELPVSTAEVQQAAIEMAKGGIEPATIAAGGLRDVLNLAAAGGVGIAEAAEIASKQLGVWVDQAASAQEKAAFLTQAVDLLSQAANASTVDVDDLALGLANSGKSADLAGLSFRETVTSMALISSGFSSAADAGTSFKTFLTRLQPVTDSQAEAFKRLNLLTKEGQSVFYDASGSFIGMEKAAGVLKASLEGMSVAQRKAALEAAFGSDAIRAAGMLADAGAEGYANMAAEMAKAGSAAVQAARKQQGYNVALDNAMGSLEALQITVMTAALPALTKLLNVLAGGINAITDYADATIKGETALAKVASVVQDAAIPALLGLTTALIAYAVVQVATAAPATMALITRVAEATTAFYANATAVLTAMAPYALIAVAVAGVAWAYNDFTSKVSDATTTLLESRQWWTDAGAALDDYATQVGTAKDALAPYATEIENVRAAIQRETEELGKRMALNPEGDYTSEMDHINALVGVLQRSTATYTEQEQALINATAASMTATSQAGQLALGEAGLSMQTSLTTKDIEDLGKQIQKTFQDGQTALTTYAQNYSAFATGVEERSDAFAAKIAELEAKKQAATTAEQAKGIDEQIAALKASYAEQEQSAAESYAAQQAAQQQHLGQMLIDYTVAQAQLGNISKEKAAEITAALEEEYGLQESSTATTFLNMAQSIDEFASSSGESIDGLIGDLRSQQQQAAETQQAMDQYAKEYVATQVNNFLDGKSDAESYIGALNSIPREIRTTVRTNYVSEGDSTGARATQGSDRQQMRAGGGTMEPGESYITGELGRELVTPTTASYVTPNDALRRAEASAAQQGTYAARGAPNQVTNTTTYQMPIYTNQSPAVLEQSLAIVEALSA